MSETLFEIPSFQISWVYEAPEGYSVVHDLGAVDGMLFFEADDVEWMPVGWVIPVGDRWGFFVYQVYRGGLGDLLRHGLCDTEDEAISEAYRA